MKFGQNNGSKSPSMESIKHFFHRPLCEEDWSYLPLNGQFLRALKIEEIFNDFRPTILIETGTYLGSTTQFLLRHDSAKFFSIEKNQDYLNVAIERINLLNSSQNVEFICGDSATEVGNVLMEHAGPNDRVFAYLDAHWENELPLKAEVQAIINYSLNYVIVIDDFRVETDLEYGFDSFLGEPINNQLEDINGKFETWVPRTFAKEESGARRGTGYIFSTSAKKSMSRSTLKGLRKLNNK